MRFTYRTKLATILVAGGVAIVCPFVFFIAMGFASVWLMTATYVAYLACLTILEYVVLRHTAVR